MTKRKITAITFFLAVIFFISACGSEKPALDPDLVDGSIAEPVAENENPFESLGYITLTVVVSSIKGINDFLDDCAKTFTKKYPNIGFEFVKEKDYFTTYNYSFFSETLSNNVLYTVASQGLLDEIGDMDKAVKNSIKEIESELGNDFIGKDIYESLYNSIYVSLYESIRLSALDSIKDLLDTMYELKMDSYETAVSDILLTGATADLILAPKWYLPYNSHLHGHLHDIYSLMDNDEMFNPDDYFMNVINAQAINGKLYEFPLNFKLNFVAIGNHMPASLIEEFKQKKTVDWFWLKEAHERYGNWQGRKISVHQNFFMCDAFTYTVPSFYDYTQGGGWLDDVQLVKLFDDALHSGEKPEQYIILSGLLPSEEIKLQDKNMFVKLPHDAWQYFYPTNEAGAGHRFINPLPYSDDKGRIVTLSDFSTLNFCISENSMYKEVAWEFIKHMTLPETNGLGETYRNVPGDRPVYSGCPIYKPTYMAVHDSIMPKRMGVLSGRPYNIGYTGDLETQRAYIAGMIEDLAQLPVFALPYRVSRLNNLNEISDYNSGAPNETKIDFPIYQQYAEIAVLYGRERLIPMWPFPDGFVFDFGKWMLAKTTEGDDKE